MRVKFEGTAGWKSTVALLGECFFNVPSAFTLEKLLLQSFSEHFNNYLRVWSFPRFIGNFRYGRGKSAHTFSGADFTEYLILGAPVLSPLSALVLPTSRLEIGFWLEGSAISQESRLCIGWQMRWKVVSKPTGSIFYTYYVVPAVQLHLMSVLLTAPTQNIYTVLWLRLPFWIPLENPAAARTRRQTTCFGFGLCVFHLLRHFLEHRLMFTFLWEIIVLPYFWNHIISSELSS